MGKAEEIIGKYASVDESIPEFGPWLASERARADKDAALALLWSDLEAEIASGSAVLADDPELRKAKFDALIANLPAEPVAGRPVGWRVWRPLLAVAAALAVFLLLNRRPDLVRDLDTEPDSMLSEVSAAPENSALQGSDSEYLSAEIPADGAVYKKTVFCKQSPSEMTGCSQNDTILRATPAKEPVAVADGPDVPPANQAESSEMVAGDNTAKQWAALVAEDAAARKKTIRRKPTLYAGISASGTSSALRKAMAPVDFYNYAGDGATTGSDGDYAVKYNNWAPVDLGIDVSIPVFGGFDIRAGLMYSRLYSRVTENIGGKESAHDNVFEYVSCPVSFGYSFVEKPHYRMYCAAGGAVACCVGGADEHPLQFSTGLSLGAEYRFSPHIGVCLEPSLRYYFDNGSSIVNYYSSHPLAVGVKLGIAFSL